MRFSNGRGWKNLWATGNRCSRIREKVEKSLKKKFQKSFVIFFRKLTFPAKNYSEDCPMIIKGT